MLAVLAAAAGFAAGFPAVAPAAETHAAYRPAVTSTPRTGASTGFYRLVQYPQAGFAGIHDQTAAAKRSIDMEIYERADAGEQDALVAAAARGVAVRVLLDKAFNGGKVNQPTFDFLSAHGVSVRWAPSAVIFHIKATTFDHITSDVSTASLTSEYYATSRDAEIIDTNPDQVAAIETTSNADWQLGLTGQRDTTTQAPGWSGPPTPAPAPPRLSWSPRSIRRGDRSGSPPRTSPTPPSRAPSPLPRNVAWTARSS
jgi:phosphatidylserine/phosphatidylglycerophosphate/cardiolipin synthase-like enzyme